MRNRTLASTLLLSLCVAGALRAQAPGQAGAAVQQAQAVTTSPATPAPTATPATTTPGMTVIPSVAAPPVAAPPPTGPGIPVKAPKVNLDIEPTLVFDREVYSYPSGPRRDPFMALVGKHDAGPLFDDLTLRGIIYSPAGNSLVVLSDGKKTYRAHRGEMVGNARVMVVSPTRVIFSVDNFGVWRQQSLELKKNTEGDKG